MSATSDIQQRLSALNEKAAECDSTTCIELIHSLTALVHESHGDSQILQGTLDIFATLAIRDPWLALYHFHPMMVDAIKNCRDNACSRNLVLNLLQKLLKERDSTVRSLTLYPLTEEVLRAVKHDTVLVRSILGLLEDSMHADNDERNLQATAHILGQIGFYDMDPITLDHIVKLLNEIASDSRSDVREYVAYALKSLIYTYQHNVSIVEYLNSVMNKLCSPQEISRDSNRFVGRPD